MEDCAEAIVQATERYEDPDPLNIGTGAEISIRSLVELIGRLTGFQEHVHWDRSQPDGQPRRRLDVRRIHEVPGFSAEMPLERGLKETIDWYVSEFRSERIQGMCA